MTIIRNFEMQCPVCGETSKHPRLASSNTQGYADMDLRPPEMYRSTMGAWIMECPHCRYVSRNFDQIPEIDEEFLKTDEYQKCGGFEFRKHLSEKFYRQYLLSDDPKEKFYAILHCVWACDDSEDPLAADIRKLAVELINSLIDENPANQLDLIIQKADLMRRAGEFDELIRTYEKLEFSEIYKDIIDFQLERAYEKDDGCYTLEEVHK